MHAHIAYAAAKCVEGDVLDAATATALLEAQCFLAAYDDDDESHSLVDADVDPPTRKRNLFWRRARSG